MGGKGKKGKTLREVYAADKAATAFLKKHPEMAGYDLEETTGQPGGTPHMFHEREATLTSEATAKILEALPHYPDRPVAEALQSFYDGASVAHLARLQKPRRVVGVMKQQLYRWRAGVLLWAAARPWERRRLSPADITDVKKRLVYGKEARSVFCIKGTWVDEEWNVLPSEIQAALDQIEWDFLDLSVTEAR